MFDRQAIEAAEQAWRNSEDGRLQRTAYFANEERAPTGRRALAMRGLAAVTGESFDQLSGDLRLITRCELMLHEAETRLRAHGRSEREKAADGRTRVALRTVGRPGDAAEDEQIDFELSDAIVESHARGDTATRLDDWRLAERAAAFVTDVYTEAAILLRTHALDARDAYHAAESAQRRRHGYLNRV